MTSAASTRAAIGSASAGRPARRGVAREIAHEGLTTLHVVDSMHERKRRMADLARMIAGSL